MMNSSLKAASLAGSSGPRANRETRPSAANGGSLGRTSLALAIGLALGMTFGAGGADAKGGTAVPPKAPPPPAPIVVAVPPPPAVPAPVFSAAVTDIHAFGVIGFIQDATVSGALCPGLPASQWGGTAMIDGLTITIPCNTILQMPAATFTWAELFDKTTFPEPLSLFDIAATPSPSVFKYPSTEINVVGNIVGGKHIAGLVLVSQQSVNFGTGYITRIDYATGAIFVGGVANGPDRARLVINDPNGRYGKPHSPDARFSVDDENPTIAASTGYPMCVPRTDPATADDPLCPRRNRPLAAAGCRNFAAAGVVSPAGWELSPPAPGQLFCSAFVMEDPSSLAVTAAGSTRPDAKQQAPFKPGDFIAYQGTLLRDGSGVGGAATISVHTISANVGLFTQPHTLPVYLAIGQFAIGMDTPATAINGLPQEAPNRLVLEASVTDVTSVVDIYLVDIDPATGNETQRWITPESMTGGVTPGTPPFGGGITTQLIGPQPGRARIQANKAPIGILVSPTRNVRVVARQLCTPDHVNSVTAGVPCLHSAPAANGLFTGQYMAPTFNYIFPENIVAGDAIVPADLWDLGFLMNGEGPGTGRLIPTPW
jgi:hypothetical protein